MLFSLVKLFQRVKTSELLTKTFLHFRKNIISSSFSLSVMFGEFLAKCLNQTNNGKGFSMDMVSRTSFMILVYHSLNYSV